ncbi:hypothetical protein OROGR_004840 [Orobanche gracilis]
MYPCSFESNSVSYGGLSSLNPDTEEHDYATYQANNESWDLVNFTPQEDFPCPPTHEPQLNQQEDYYSGVDGSSFWDPNSSF